MTLVEKVSIVTPLDPFLSLKALSTYSGLSVRKLRQLIDRDAADALPCYRVDGRVLVRRSDFDEYMNRYRVSGRPGVVAALREIGLMSTSDAGRA
jgi:Helix-turn-helix domain